MRPALEYVVLELAAMRQSLWPMYSSTVCLQSTYVLPE